MLVRLHDAIFGGLQSLLDGWATGLLARVTFGSVLLFYFWNSALRKVVASERGAEGGWLEYITVSGNSFAQMAPVAFEEAGYDSGALGIEYWLMAYGGTYAEFILPALVVVGLFTRLASLGMLGFIGVQTWVDITGHGADEKTIGVVFDRIQDSAILDQRALWAFVLIYLVIRGAGAVSVDGLLRGMRG